MEPAVAMQHRLSLGQPLLVGLRKAGMEQALGVTEVTTAAVTQEGSRALGELVC